MEEAFQCKKEIFFFPFIYVLCRNEIHLLVTYVNIDLVVHIRFVKFMA
jgi:hypothetical protein